MTSNNGSVSPSQSREFDLHLHVLEHSSHGGAPRYTIGVWDRTRKGAGLRAVCHMRPLAEAMPAVAKELGERARLETLEIKYPKWSEIVELVRHLHSRGDTDSATAAEMLEDLQARLHNTTADLELAWERLSRLGTLIEEAAARSHPLAEHDGASGTIGVPQSVWFRLLAAYRDRQEGRRLYQELQALREVAGITAETLRTVDEWLGNASTREAAMDALWRLRRILEGLGYPMPIEHLVWRGQIISAMEEAGLGLGVDGALRVRRPEDPYWQPATGALVKEILQNAQQPMT